MGLRLPEVLIILVVLVLVFGANKIPQLGDALGKGIRNFRKSARDGDDSIDVTPKPDATKDATKPEQLPHSSARAAPSASNTAEQRKA